MMKHEKKCALAARSPVLKIDSPQSNRRLYTHKPKNDTVEETGYSHKVSKDLVISSPTHLMS